MNCCDALTNRTVVVFGETNNVTANYVHCGQVYVVSGQSNAAFPVKDADNGTAEIAAALGKRQIRLFVVPHHPQATPQKDVKAQWVEASPETVADFSAIGWMFARHVSEMYWGDLPFGLIMTTFGGTRAEAWSPPEVMEACKGVPVNPKRGAQNNASALWNGMVAPLTKYSIRGVVWFQGEHNVVNNDNRELYSCLFSGMINAWRDAWRGIGDFPFIYAQLAPYFCYSPGVNGTECDISAVRLAQADCQPHIGLDTTGMAVTIDLGDPTSPLGSVHSRHKTEVARRLALQAV